MRASGEALSSGDRLVGWKRRPGVNGDWSSAWLLMGWANGPQESALGAARNEQALGFGDNAPCRSRPRSEGAQERRRTGLHFACPPCPQNTLSRSHSGRAFCARRSVCARSQGSTRLGSARLGLTPSRRWRGRRTMRCRVCLRRAADSEVELQGRVGLRCSFRDPRPCMSALRGRHEWHSGP